MRDDDIDNTTPTVRIAHYFVQEYLESAHIIQSNAKFFRMDKFSAYSEIAKICLVYLLEDGLLIPPFDKHLIQQFPLSCFAAKYWHHHYRAAAASGSELDALVLSLFQSRQSLAAWVKLYNVDRDWYSEIDFGRQPEKIATPIYYTSLLGSEKISSNLISELPAATVVEQVNLQGGLFGNALQAASLEGHQNIVQMLLAKGGKYGYALQAVLERGGQIES